LIAPVVIVLVIGMDGGDRVFRAAQAAHLDDAEGAGGGIAAEMGLAYACAPG
jgi:hypothetical protein